MKFVLTSLLILVLGMIAVGFYIKGQGNPSGEVVIGIAVLIIAFILMPLFIYKRYKNKKISDFKFENFRKDLEERSK